MDDHSDLSKAGMQFKNVRNLGDERPVVRSMVSANHWLSSIKANRLSWYLTLVSANQATTNSAQVDNAFVLVH